MKTLHYRKSAFTIVLSNLAMFVFIFVWVTVDAVFTKVSVNLTENVTAVDSILPKCGKYWCSNNQTINEGPGLAAGGGFIKSQLQLQNKIWPIDPIFIGATNTQKTNTTITTAYLYLTGELHINPFYGIGLQINWTKTGKNGFNNNPLYLFYYQRVGLGNASLSQICLYDCFE